MGNATTTLNITNNTLRPAIVRLLSYDKEDDHVYTSDVIPPLGFAVLRVVRDLLGDVKAFCSVTFSDRSVVGFSFNVDDYDTSEHVVLQDNCVRFNGRHRGVLVLPPHREGNMPAYSTSLVVAYPKLPVVLCHVLLAVQPPPPLLTTTATSFMAAPVAPVSQPVPTQAELPQSVAPHWIFVPDVGTTARDIAPREDLAALPPAEIPPPAPFPAFPSAVPFPEFPVQGEQAEGFSDEQPSTLELQASALELAERVERQQKQLWTYAYFLEDLQQTKEASRVFESGVQVPDGSNSASASGLLLGSMIGGRPVKTDSVLRPANSPLGSLIGGVAPLGIASHRALFQSFFQRERLAELSLKQSRIAPSAAALQPPAVLWNSFQSDTTKSAVSGVATVTSVLPHPPLEPVVDLAGLPGECQVRLLSLANGGSVRICDNGLVDAEGAFGPNSQFIMRRLPSGRFQFQNIKNPTWLLAIKAETVNYQEAVDDPDTHFHLERRPLPNEPNAFMLISASMNACLAFAPNGSTLPARQALRDGLGSSFQILRFI
eukprot:m.808683 g.808683  ORF g.808683 m.808683 type:complete len:544 (+) comp59315_c0_seq2:1465-3096(+)